MLLYFTRPRAELYFSEGATEATFPVDVALWWPNYWYMKVAQSVSSKDSPIERYFLRPIP